jgi:hypothetical protein
MNLQGTSRCAPAPTIDTRANRLFRAFYVVVLCVVFTECLLSAWAAVDNANDRNWRPGWFEGLRTILTVAEFLLPCAGVCLLFLAIVPLWREDRRKSIVGAVAVVLLAGCGAMYFMYFFSSLGMSGLLQWVGVNIRPDSGTTLPWVRMVLSGMVLLVCVSAWCMLVWIRGRTFGRMGYGRADLIFVRGGAVLCVLFTVHDAATLWAFEGWLQMMGRPTPASSGGGPAEHAWNLRWAGIDSAWAVALLVAGLWLLRAKP